MSCVPEKIQSKKSRRDLLQCIKNFIVGSKENHTEIHQSFHHANLLFMQSYLNWPIRMVGNTKIYSWVSRYHHTSTTWPILSYQYRVVSSFLIYRIITSAYKAVLVFSGRKWKQRASSSILKWNKAMADVVFTNQFQKIIFYWKHRLPYYDYHSINERHF